MSFTCPTCGQNSSCWSKIGRPIIPGWLTSSPINRVTLAGLTFEIIEDPSMPPGEAEFISSTGQRVRVTGLAVEPS